MIRVNLREFDTTDKWLKLRTSGIGGSDASIVMGINKYKSQIELWLEKTGTIEPEETENEATYFGKLMEPVIREEFERRTGLKVEKPKFMYRSRKYPFMIANLDGELEDSIYGHCVFEAKTVSAYKKDEWKDGIPKEYYLQVQHYMAVTGYRGAYIAALIGGNEFIYNFISRDEEMITALVEAENHFWYMVKHNILPEIDGSDAAKNYVDSLYPDSVSKSVFDMTDEAGDILDEYDRIVSEEKRLKDEKQEIENRIKMIMKDNETGKIGSRTVTWKNVVSKRLDSKLLKINEPEIYEKYLYDSDSRRFSIK